MQMPKPQSTIKRAVPPPPPLPPGYEHRRKTPVPKAPAVPAPAPKPAKPSKQPKPDKTKPAKQSRKTKDLQNTAVATKTRKAIRPRMANPYASLHEVRAPYTQFPSTLTALAEIFFLLEYDQVLEFKPRTLGEHMIRSAWLKAIHGDTKAMTLLWDRIHIDRDKQKNPLADFLASLGQSAGLKPVTQYPEDQDDED